MGRVRSLIGTLLLGGLAGFVFASCLPPIMEESGRFGNDPESPKARQYMVGLLENEADTLAAVTPKADIVSRAMVFLTTQEAQGAWKAQTLTYLGGRTTAGVSIQMYAIELRNAAGRQRFIPLALTLRGGTVIRRE
jgi:hypothetical protein